MANDLINCAYVMRLPQAKSWLIGKDSDTGRDWGQEEKGTTEDEMAGWHHWLDECVWVNSGSWWWTGRPGVLRFMGLQRVGHDWATELNWTELNSPVSKTGSYTSVLVAREPRKAYLTLLAALNRKAGFVYRKEETSLFFILFSKLNLLFCIGV